MSDPTARPGPANRASVRLARRGPPCRRFTLLDLMILVAGAAVGIVGGQDLLLGFRDPGDRLFKAHRLAGICLMLSSWLVLVFRLRRPRPSIRRIARQPGPVACFAVVVAMLATDASWMVRVVREGALGQVGPLGEWIWILLDYGETEHACVVPVAWALLALGGRWRPEPGWIDRSGRALGWGWILWVIVGPFT